MLFRQTKDFNKNKKVKKEKKREYISKNISFQSHLNGAYIVPRQIKILKVGIRIEAVPLEEI